MKEDTRVVDEIFDGNEELSTYSKDLACEAFDLYQTEDMIAVANLITNDPRLTVIQKVWVAEKFGEAVLFSSIMSKKMSPLVKDE